MILRDLGHLMQACRNRYDALPPAMTLEVPREFWLDFKQAYEKESGDTVVEFDEQWFSISASRSERSDISARWLLYAYAFAPYHKQLLGYRNVLNQVLISSGNISGLSRRQILELLPATDWAAKADALAPTAGIPPSAAIEARIRTLLPHTSSATLFSRFLADGSWWGQGKSLSRAEKDWLGSAMRSAARVIHANSDRLPLVIQTIAGNPSLQRQLRRLIRKGSLAQPTVARRSGGRNLIYYGAPGTGKSHSIDRLVLSDAPGNVVRTVFHAETQYNDFVGNFRPTVTAGEIGYSYQPGPFTVSLVRAMNSPGEMHYLVIEEINRASAAAVFGEIFQLLDRDAAGASVYSISPSDPAQEAYLAASITSWTGEIRLPSNLCIIASMNSSDQAVMPLDTAFKRRWRFEYMPVSFDTCPDGALPVPNGAGGHMPVKWSGFAQAINEALAEIGVPEDRLLGPYFLSDSELDDVAKPVALDSPGARALSGKLFLYLWDDVLRHGSRDAVFSGEINTYGQLVRKFGDGHKVFGERVHRKLFPTSTIEGESGPGE
jgi:5-methylcytosine-specific restriction protein B